MKKCKPFGEVAIIKVGEVGVKTKARGHAMTETNSKKRKICGTEFELSSSLVELKTQDNFVSRDPCTSPASCCSSNGSTVAEKDWFKFVDLEEDSTEIEAPTNSRKRRETTPLNELGLEPGELESTARPMEVNPRCQIIPQKVSSAELEEFFITAEKNLTEKFTDRYNYDIMNDVPLEGRYEWVRQKR